MMNILKFENVAAIGTSVLIVVALTACGGGKGTAASASVGSGDAGALEIKTLSNRADMISDGDAYVEVVLPAGASLADMSVDVDGVDVTGSFAARNGGRILGVLTALKNGANVVTAKLKTSGAGARLVVTNTDRGGPIFSGPQSQPWICATKSGTQATVGVPNSGLSATVTTRVSGLESDPVDDKCNAPAKFTYYYQPVEKAGTGCTLTVTGPNPCFIEYDPKARPENAKIADFTNDKGNTVKSMLRLELGTADRGTYQVLSYYDPALPWTPWAPQGGWNGKLMWKFGAAASGNRFQQNASASADIFGASVFDANALAAGFMVANAQLTNHLDNPNEVIAAEQMMMVKEHIVDTYGEIVYTMADGQSGGAIMQTVISSVMPGLLQGLQTYKSYPEGVGFFIEVRECGALSKFYQTPAGAALTEAQRTAVEGKPSGYCKTWVDSFTSAQVPTIPTNCGSGFPAAIVYDPNAQPTGVRCSPFETMVNILGTTVDVDSNVKPKMPYDNVGVQYGFLALRNGDITAEQFVQLNEQVGAFDADMNWTGGNPASPTVPAPRFRSLVDAFPAMYRSGFIANAKNLAKVAIVDVREEMGPDIHQAWRSASMRARLDTVNGGHENHVIRGSLKLTGNALTAQAFNMTDRWLAAVRGDKSTASLEQKIIANRPADVRDGCYATTGATNADLATELALSDRACPLSSTLTQQKSPRMAAGGPLAEDVFKCQLKALDAASTDYNGVAFTTAQVTRLKAVFPDGVCDWSKAGVGQTTQAVPTSFMSGAGLNSTAIPAAPTSSPL